MSVVWEIAALVQFIANYLVVSECTQTHTYTQTHTHTHLSVTIVFELYMLIWMVNTLQSENTINTYTRTHSVSFTHTSHTPTHPYHINIPPSTPHRHERTMSLSLFLLSLTHALSFSLSLSLTHTCTHTTPNNNSHLRSATIMSIARGPTWCQLALEIIVFARLRIHQYTFGLEFAHSQIFHKFLCVE